MAVHVEAKRVYFSVFAALLALTALTVVAAYVDLGRLNDAVAIAIAVAKAGLVILFFMHVRHATPLTRLVIAGSVFMLLLLFLFTLSDYLTRGWIGPGAGPSGGSFLG